MTIGQAETLVIHMSMPGMEMTKLNIDLKKLNLFIGANGVGKSLVMKLTWVLNMVGQLVIKKCPDLKQGAQYILDNSIPEHDMMAYLAMEFETGALVVIQLLEGKVQSVHYTGFEKIDELTRCIYMSAEMRLFTSIKQYLTMRKMMGSNVEKLVEHYKLYDIMYIEGLIHRMPITFEKNHKAMLNMAEMDDLTTVEFTGDDFVGVWKDGNKRVLSTLGDGHQAIINMTLASI